MEIPGEISLLCRLCLANDEVNVPIFGEQSDIRQISLKISSCLPVKIAADDLLPKNICEGCSDKLELLYTFSKTSQEAEKKLLVWVEQVSVNNASEAITAVAKQIVDSTEVKEESDEGHKVNVKKSFDELVEDAEEKEPESEAPPPKRARRTAAVKAQISISQESEDEDDVDMVEPLTKVEDESEVSDSESVEPHSSFVDVPGTSADEQQPGPSGVQKDGADAPNRLKMSLRKCSRQSNKMGELLDIILKESDDDLDYKTQDLRDPDFKNPIKEEQEKPQQKKSKKSDSKPHPCHECSKLFISKLALARHAKKGCKNDHQDQPKNRVIKLENGKRMYLCKKCPRTFNTVKQLQTHRKEHLPKEYVESHIYSFDDIQELYVCNTCSAEFKDEEEAKGHVKGHSEIFDCNFCEDKFQTLFQLGTHIKTSHSEDEHFNCPLCPEQKFSKPSLFMKHVAIKHQKRYMYNCEECGRGFHSKTLCREHQNMHKGIKPFVCVVCNAGFTYSKSVVTHQLKAHRVEILGKSHATECTFCRHRFVTVASLERHVQQCHSTPKAPKEKIHLCDICGMGFAKKNKMVVHQRVHTGVKPYPCRYCEKHFSKSGERNCHERIHTGERPYSCEYCGKAFRQSAPFKVHIRTHTGERPYVCDLCLKGFTTNQGLKLHKKNCSSSTEYKYY